MNEAGAERRQADARGVTVVRSQAYYDVVSTVGGGSWQPQRDARPWVRFCLTAHFRQATTLLGRAREMDRLWVVMEDVARARVFPERAMNALMDGALGLRVRNVTYRTAAGVSDQLASRDLRQIVDAGLLIPRGERRGRFYEGADLLRELRRQTTESKVVVDPFAESS
ncbi:MAG: hypothetical protein NVS1B4_22520 [Gemmatimonadaceae bacterium]